jgi:hypothetical protein
MAVKGAPQLSASSNRGIHSLTITLPRPAAADDVVFAAASYIAIAMKPEDRLNSAMCNAIIGILRGSNRPSKRNFGG